MNETIYGACYKTAVANPNKTTEEHNRRKESVRASEDRGDRRIGRDDDPDPRLVPFAPSLSSSATVQTKYAANSSLSPPAKVVGIVTSQHPGRPPNPESDHNGRRESWPETPGSGRERGDEVNRESGGGNGSNGSDEVRSSITSGGGESRASEDGHAPPLRSLRKSFARTFGLRGAFSGKYSGSGGP